MEGETKIQQEATTEEQSQIWFLEKLKIHKFKILGGILGILVFIGAVFGAYKLGQRSIYPEPVEGPTPTPVVVATPTPDSTANWEIYTNTKYGYSIKYPEDWSEQLKCEGGAITDDYICFLSPDFEESLAGAIMGSTVKGGVVLIDGQGGVVGLPPDGVCVPGGPVYISECKEITVGDLQAMQRKIGDTQIQIGILKSGKFILDIKAIYNVASKDEITKAFNLMLSTFRFISEEGTGEKVFCKEPRPQFCTMECIVNPPYICGSDGKSYCSECQACSNSEVEWYVIQDESCKEE